MHVSFRYVSAEMLVEHVAVMRGRQKDHRPHFTVRVNKDCKQLRHSCDGASAQQPLVVRLNTVGYMVRQRATSESCLGCTAMYQHNEVVNGLIKVQG